MRMPPRSTRASLSADAEKALDILDHFNVKAGGALPLKPIFLQWAKRGGAGGADLIAALGELADAGLIEPTTADSEEVVRR